MDLIIKQLKSGKKIGFVPMTTRMEQLAAEKVGDASKFSGQLRYLNEQLRMTIREIDGQACNYEVLADLDAFFTYAEVVELRKHLNDINFGGQEESPLEPTA